MTSSVDRNRKDVPAVGRRDLPLHIASSLDFIRALLAPKTEMLAVWLKANQLMIDHARWLYAQGLAPYAYSRLRGLNLLGELPDESRELLQNAYYSGALLEALQHEEAIKTVLSVLTEAGIETVVLKGMALALTVYSNPRWRLKADLDLWVQPVQLAEAIAALQKVGYQPHDNQERPPALTYLFGGEQQLTSDIPGRGLVELHWPAIRGEWVRLTAALDHDGIWARRQQVVADGLELYVMALEDMFLHICLHLAINHKFNQPWLRGLLDVHLIVQKLSEKSWQEIIQRAQAWRITTVLWTVLNLSRKLLATPVPDVVLSTLSPSPLRCRLIEQLRLEQSLLEMWPGGDYQYYHTLILLLLVDRLQDAGKLLWRSLFPEAEWLQARYGTNSTTALWRARLLHPWSLLSSAKV